MGWWKRLWKRLWCSHRHCRWDHRQNPSYCGRKDCDDCEERDPGYDVRVCLDCGAEGSRLGLSLFGYRKDGDEP